MESSEIQLEIDRQKEIIKSKPFVVKYKKLRDVLKYVFYGFAVLSAGTGFGLFYEFARHIMNPFFSVIVSALLLLLVELGEGASSNEAFNNYFEKKAIHKLGIGKISFIRAFVCAFFICLSMLISVLGSYYSYQEYNTIQSGIVSTYKLQSDSVKYAHDTEIERMVSEAEQYRASNMVKEKKGMALRFSSTATYNNMMQAIADARKAKNEKVANIEASEITDLFEGKTQSDFNSYAVAVWVLLLMICKTANHWFKNYYAYRVAVDNSDVSELIGRKPSRGEHVIIQEDDKPMKQIVDRVGDAPVVMAEKKSEPTPKLEVMQEQPIISIKDELHKILNTDKVKADRLIKKWGKALADPDLCDNPSVTKQILANKYACSEAQIDKLRRNKRMLLNVIGEDAFYKLVG